MARPSGRPSRRISFTAAWANASHLSLGEVVILVIGITLLAVVVQPLQLAMVRMAEGSWPAWLGSGWAQRWQEHRRKRLRHAAQLPASTELTDEAIQRAGAAGYQLRRRFPMPEHLLRPTALGNVLAAMEDAAGRPYGLDAVTAWPRLYPVLGERVRSLVDDRRDALDAAIRMAVTMAVTALISLILLLRSGGWAVLALIPLAVAVLAYSSAVQAALAYAETFASDFVSHFPAEYPAIRRRVRPVWRLIIMSDRIMNSRKTRRRLAPSEKYEIFVSVLTGQATQREAAERWKVDRSTVVHICRTAKQGALGALSASAPGRPGMNAEQAALAEANAELARLRATVTEQAVALHVSRRWIPRSARRHR